MDEKTEAEAETGNEDVSETGAAQARMRRTPWRGWLMAVPLAAAALVAYLVLRTWVLSGPTITVTFPRSNGIKPKDTVVKYKGVKVGQVSGVELVDHLRKVKVTLDMDSSVADAINAGTRFWLVKPSIASGDITSLLAGAHIGMRPGHSDQSKDAFQGSLKPPALPMPSEKRKGTIVTLAASKKGSLGHGAKVLYKGFDAGKVLGAKYDAKTDSARIEVFVKAPYNQHLDAGTRFWRTGGVGIAKKSGGIDIKTPPITSLLQGGVAFGSWPGTAQSAGSGVEPHHYHLYGSKDNAKNALTGPSVRFALAPKHSLHGLTKGAAVSFQHIKVGTVRKTQVHYDATRHRMDASAIIALYARPFGITGTDKGAVQGKLKKAVADLVKHGLRARLTSAGLILGGEKVVLDMSGEKGASQLLATSKLPGIPVVASTGSLSNAVSKLNQIASKINEIPITRIGRNVQQATAHIDQLTGSSKVKRALANLEQSLANVKVVTAKARTHIGPTMKALQQAAQAADSAADQIKQTIGGQGGQPGVSQLVDELTRTARSIRALTSYLQRHPAALLRGRSQ